MTEQREQRCDQCGRPISICNARAMLDHAIQRHGPVKVGREIADLLAAGDGIIDDTAPFLLKSRVEARKETDQ